MFSRHLRSAALAALLIPGMAHASVVVSGTRVIYAEPAREVTVKLTNAGQKPSLVQAWIDDGDENATPATARAPFTLTPPVFRVDPTKGQTLRLFKSSSIATTDRESLYWLNILDVPPKPKAGENSNQILFAFRTRIKLFYRPAGLAMKVEEAPQRLKLSAKAGPDKALTLENPTPYYFTVTRITSEAGRESVIDQAGAMVSPQSQHSFKIVGNASLLPGKPVTLSYIDDYGSERTVELNLGP